MMLLRRPLFALLSGCGGGALNGRAHYLAQVPRRLIWGCSFQFSSDKPITRLRGVTSAHYGNQEQPERGQSPKDRERRARYGSGKNAEA